MEDKLLLEHLIKSSGGRKAVERELVKSRLVNAISGGTTIGQLLKKAQDEGWYDSMMSVKFSSLVGQVEETKVVKKTKTAKKVTRTRLSAAEKENLVNGILDFLRKFPDSSFSDITKAVEFDKGKVRVQIAALKKENKVQSKGTLRNTTYSLV